MQVTREKLVGLNMMNIEWTSKDGEVREKVQLLQLYD